MASITKYTTASGAVKWRVQYRTPDNKLTGARRFATTVHVSKLRGEYIDPADSRVTIGDLGPGWLARRTHLNRRVGASRPSLGGSTLKRVGAQ